jgi:predicted TIM-barrel fold metal-dependent hydrolase
MSVSKQKIGRAACNMEDLSLRSRRKQPGSAIMKINRRQFSAQVASAATAVAAWPGAALAQEAAVTAELPIIDCHQHLWDRTKFKLAWIQPGTILDRSYLMKDYLEAIAGTGIRHSVYMEVDVDPAQQQSEADHLIEICQSKAAPTIAAVVSGRPAAASFAPHATQFKGSPYIKGIRQVLHGSSTPAGYCLGESFVRGIKLLGELGLSFDLCLRPADLGDGVKLAELCPDTQFILDHCGNADPKAFFKAGDPRLKDAKPAHAADPWRRDIERLAARKNVVCKISGIVARVSKEWSAGDLAPIVNHCLDSFGPERAVFGSDWPVCLGGAPLREWVVALRTIVASRPAEEQRKLLSENAHRLYKLAV